MNVETKWREIGGRRGITLAIGTHKPKGVVTPVIVAPMPNQPKTPQRAVRISDQLWKDAQTKAKRQGETVTDVIRRALEQYVSEPL